MILELNKIDTLIEGLSEEKSIMILTSYIKYRLIHDEIKFINNFMKCQEVFKWNNFKNKEELVDYIANTMIKMYLDKDINFIDSARLVVLKIEESNRYLNFELLTTL